MVAKIMKNMKYIRRAIVAMLLFVVLFLFKGCYIDQNNGYTLEFDSMDKGIEYQVFYTTKSKPDLSEENSVKLQSAGNLSEFGHYEIYIPTEESIENIRIDFGNTQGEIKIKNIKLVGNEETVVPLEAIIAGFSGDIESYELVEDYLEINSNKADPYSIFSINENKPIHSTELNYSDLVDLCIVYFMVIGGVFYLIKQYHNKNRIKNKN